MGTAEQRQQQPQQLPRPLRCRRRHRRARTRPHRTHPSPPPNRTRCMHQRPPHEKVEQTEKPVPGNLHTVLVLELLKVVNIHVGGNDGQHVALLAQRVSEARWVVPDQSTEAQQTHNQGHRAYERVVMAPPQGSSSLREMTTFPLLISTLHSGPGEAHPASDGR